MIPLNKKAIEKAMKQLGMKQKSIEAERVIIEKANGRIIIENPEISLINLAGQEFFQISGSVKEISEDKISEEDIKLVMEKTNASFEEAKKALEETNDIAEAILKLKK